MLTEQILLEQQRRVTVKQAHPDRVGKRSNVHTADTIRWFQ